MRRRIETVYQIALNGLGLYGLALALVIIGALHLGRDVPPLGALMIIVVAGILGGCAHVLWRAPPLAIAQPHGTPDLLPVLCLGPVMSPVFLAAGVVTAHAFGTSEEWWLPVSLAAAAPGVVMLSVLWWGGLYLCLQPVPEDAPPPIRRNPYARLTGSSRLTTR